ncbi:hypothetical protein ABTZ21_13610 [Streptomyces sp. NPDC096191]|uniref:hypothetical protein n=1 Tax=Streptomyces sp. NPDC096191 TaxID=3155426 RepID=UPI00332CD7FA
MRARAIVFCSATALALALTACSAEEGPTADTAASRSAVAAQEEAARKAAGLPPEPSATARYRYLEALDAIDERISEPGTDEQAVSRGLNQCGSINATPDDTAKLAQQALERFTIDTRLPDINTVETGERLVQAVHKHLCPDY